MLDKLIKYFVYATKGYITKTQLIKFLYLADLYSVKWTGQQLTELDWCYYNFGPWNQDIDTPLSLRLVLDNIRREWAGAGQEKLKALLEYVYSTAPMLAVKDTHKPEEKIKLNLLVEREKLISELGL